MIGLNDVLPVEWTLLVVCLCPFVITYIATSLNAFINTQWPQHNAKAPLAPYAIPFVGHAFLFFVDTTKLASMARKVFKGPTPVRLSFFHVEANVVSGAENISAIWKSKLLDSKPAVCMVMKRFFHMPSDSLSYYFSDNSGIGIRPHPNSNVPQHHRLYYHTHKVTHSFMNGKTLNPFSIKFQKNLFRGIANEGISNQWIENKDLFGFLQQIVSTAAIETMCSKSITRLSPNWVQDFWEFDRSLPYFLKGYPAWFAPRAWAARRRVLDGLKKWHAYAQRSFTEASIGKDGHDPFFGTEMIRQRQEYFGRMEFMNADALATEDLGLIWAENANSVPATFWFVLEMFRNKSHLVRARAEVKACYTSENEFDINMLCKQPFLQSVYAETLRLRTSLFLVRGADHGDFHLQNCTFGRGKMIAIDTGAAHTDHKVWNTGNPDSPKGADTFWAERFLVDPQDPYSGPLKPSQKTKALSEKDTSSEKAEGSTKFTMKGLDGAWIPFGGGVRQCPGKQFAKQEIILSFAILCTAFDIELLEEKNYVSDMRYYGLGGMPVKGKVPFKIRLRAG